LKGFSDEDAESFAGIVAEPAAFETVFYAKFKTILEAFRNDSHIGAKAVEVLSFARQCHFAIPDDDSHGGGERKAIIRIVADLQDGKGEEEERFLTAQPDRFAGAKR
jgi:hypothetical protein